MEIYLDNSATTKPSECVIEKMMEVFTKDYGNPSSMHTKGMEAENYLKEARKNIANILKAQEKEIYFTSGGTESNNLAIIGGALAYKRAGNRVITTKIEHASVAQPFESLKEMGFDVVYLPVDKYGIVDLDALKEAMTPDTILVSIMAVNNEIGAVEPLEEIGKIVKEVNKDCLYHVDAIQAFGKITIIPKKLNIDLLSVSGHKIHGPKGSGFLYIKKGIRVISQILGGGQELALRSGTENVPAIAGLGVAAKEAYDNLDENVAHMYRLRNILIDGLGKIEGVSLNGKLDNDNICHILSVSVDGVRSEVLLHSLEDKGVFVSAGSACSSNKPAISKTLQAIGLNKGLLDSTVRFSLAHTNTEEEVNAAVLAMNEIVPLLRKYVRH